MPRIPNLWIEKIVEIETVQGKRIKTKVKQYGGIWVHSALEPEEDHWAITAASTGDRITRVSTEEDALKIGQLLWNKCCLALREKTKEGMLKRLPKWVKPWILSCFRSGAYEEPDYKAGYAT